MIARPTSGAVQAKYLSSVEMTEVVSLLLELRDLTLSRSTFKRVTSLVMDLDATTNIGDGYKIADPAG